MCEADIIRHVIVSHITARASAKFISRILASELLMHITVMSLPIFTFLFDLPMKCNDEMLAHDESTNEDVEISCQEDSCFSKEDILIIRSLLALAPSPSCKETKKLLNSVNTSRISLIYNKILSLSKATNKELVHYLGVMSKFPCGSVDLDLMADLKFTAQDKYTNNAIYCYFRLVEHYYTDMDPNQRSKIFYRYIYLFNSQTAIDPSLYAIFQKTLDSSLLKVFVNKRLFVGFPFIKDFIVDFADRIPDLVVKIGYELPQFRNLAYHCILGTKDDSSHVLDWVVKRWNIQVQKSIPCLFYSYDCVPILDQVAQEMFQCLDDPAKSIDQNLKRSAKCDLCNMTGSAEQCVSKSAETRRQLKESIDDFNKSGLLKDPLNVWILRLLPRIDLRALGSFLCKQQNIEYLHAFTRTFDFNEVNILEALRIFTSSFVMGGESQVIDRVIDSFALEYVKQNSESDHIAKRHDRCKKISYGFIVLNTMFYNPSFDKKPTFEDYLSLLPYDERIFTDPENGFFSYNTDELRIFYESIKENEMKIQTHWVDSYDKFQLFKRRITEIYEMYSPISTRKIDDVCDDCVIQCYKALFRSSYKSFMFLSPESFFVFSQKIGCTAEFEEYIVHHKKDVPRFLESARLYLENISAQPDIINVIFEVLEKTEKPKGSMLPDIKTMFSKVNISENKDKPLSVLANYASSVDSFVNLRFSFNTVAVLNIKLLNNLLQGQRDYVQHICSRIIVGNADFLDDLSILNDSTQLKILSKAPDEFISLVDDSVKLKFLLIEMRKDSDISKYYDVFKNIKRCGQDAFEVMCSFNQSHDQFPRIARVTSSPDGACFEIEDSFGSILQESSNILKFFTSSCTSLNIKVAKKIHKNGCPLDDQRFTDTDRIIYLIMKCDSNDKSLVEYASCVVNYLSDSLILLLNIYESIFPVFHQISPEFSSILVKILLKRIKIFAENRISCCESSEDPRIEMRISSMLKRMTDASLISSNDVKPFVKYISSKPDIVEL